MLHYNVYDFGPFDSYQDWVDRRMSLIFRNSLALKNYQNKAVHNICEYYQVNFNQIEYTNQISNKIKAIPYVNLRTSGSQSNRSRNYRYSIPQYFNIENHHVWRYENEHNLNVPGNVIELHYDPSYIINQKYQECYLKKAGNLFPSGIHNTTHFLYFRRNTKNLNQTLELAKSLNPKYFICSPSQIEFLYSQTNGDFQIDCPVVNTREMLFPHVRKIALKMFSSVIDKMRCWDGGIGFYECKYGRLHLYDELAYVEVLENGELASTDFFNLTTPFVKYKNLDFGEIANDHCPCGVYGNFFQKFDGQKASIIYVGDYTLTGSAIVEELNSLFQYDICCSKTFTFSLYKKYQEKIFSNNEILYRIKQDSQGNIFFYYLSNPQLETWQIRALHDALNFVFYRFAGSGLEIVDQEKEFTVQPKPIQIIEDLNLMLNVKGLRNKSLYVETDMRK